MHLEGFFECSALLGAGVYLLCRKGEVVYVGQSNRAYARIYAHKNAWRSVRVARFLKRRHGIDRIHFDAVYVRPCAVSDLDRIERELIEKYLPRYNIKLVPPAMETKVVHLTIRGVKLAINASTKSNGMEVERRI